MRRLYQWAWGNRVGVERAEVLIVAVVAAVGLAVVLLSGGGSSSQPAAPAPTRQAARAPDVRSCAGVTEGRLTERVTCRTSSATLTLVAGDKPVLLPGIQARIMRAAIADGRLSLRVRVRNATANHETFNAAGRQIYVKDGRRLYASAKLPVAAHTGETGTLDFALDDAKLHAPTVDVAIVPWSELGRDKPRRLGVIRLETRGL